MRVRMPSIAWSLAGVLACAFVLLVGPAAMSAQRFPQQRSSPRAGAELYDLQRDEALGGHTLARHVGRSDADLADRLRREPDISAASTYTDVDTARRTVARALDEARDRIDNWESRRGRRPNLVLHYVQRGGPPIGRQLSRGERMTRPCDRAIVVLRWLDREQRWIVLTSYPELGR